MFEGHLSDGQADEVGQTHFVLSELRNDVVNKVVLCEFSYGVLNEEQKFVPSSRYAKVGVQLSDDDYLTVEKQKFSEKAVVEILLSHGIL